MADRAAAGRTGLRLARHLHMIAGLVAEDVHAAMAEHLQPDPEGYARQLGQLPVGWPVRRLTR